MDLDDLAKINRAWLCKEVSVLQEMGISSQILGEKRVFAHQYVQQLRIERSLWVSLKFCLL